MRSFVTVAVSPSGLPFELLVGQPRERRRATARSTAFAACLPNRLADAGRAATPTSTTSTSRSSAPRRSRPASVSPGLTFPDGHVGAIREGSDALRVDRATPSTVPDAPASRGSSSAMHKPCLSMGQLRAATIGPDLLHLLVSKRVDLVLSGHEHLYQRTDAAAPRARAAPGSPSRSTPSARRASSTADTLHRSPARAPSSPPSGTGGAVTAAGRDGRPRASATSPPASGSGTRARGIRLRSTCASPPTTCAYAFVRSAGGGFTDSWVLRRTPSLLTSAVTSLRPSSGPRRSAT